MIAVHGGVGFRLDRSLSAACADALRGDDVDVISAVSYLEDNPLFNCGHGSNLTMEGTVECEAGFMSSEGYRFGAIGAVSRLKNPCSVAKAVAVSEGYGKLIAPMVLVGKGAEEWAQKRGSPLCDPGTLITDKTQQNWKKARNMLEKEGYTETSSMDTVGAVSINDDVVEACTSSGGIILKTPGRLGHCTVFGSGMWAERRKGKSVGVSVSGCGEALTRADFCRSLARKLLERNDDSLPSEVVHSFFECEYLGSEIMTPIPPDRLYAGGIVLLQEDERYELVVFHNTPAFPFAYRHGSVMRKSLSQLPENSRVLVESYSC
ncbi:asparaginase [Ancylostoma caninum]|uniref:Asparaginase n=1 Tax=Ancylostoma caninum TaxID=29170 RepID=A0A368H8V0_ANCCA|nr:asparaginase [Ancylostoma caninum]